MTTISQSLIILTFIGRSIENLALNLMKYGFQDLIQGIENERINKIRSLALDWDIISDEKLVEFIKEDTTYIFGLVHESILKGIIDLNSFKDEYDSFFIEKSENIKEVKEKILQFKRENKIYIDQVDWKEVKNLRNSVLAHNLRDKKQNNTYSFDQVGMLLNLMERRIRCCF